MSMTTDQLSSAVTFDPREALTAIALAAARADGSVLPCEADRLEHTLGSLPLFRDQSAEHTRAMFYRVARRVQEGGATAIMSEAAGALPARLRGTAFAIGVDVLLADGRIRSTELQFLEALRGLLHPLRAGNLRPRSRLGERDVADRRRCAARSTAAAGHSP